MWYSPLILVSLVSFYPQLTTEMRIIRLNLKLTGQLAIDVVLLLCVAIILKDRKERHRYRLIDAKHGVNRIWPPLSFSVFEFGISQRRWSGILISPLPVCSPVKFILLLKYAPRKKLPMTDSFPLMLEGPLTCFLNTYILSYFLLSTTINYYQHLHLAGPPRENSIQTGKLLGSRPTGRLIKYRCREVTFLCTFGLDSLHNIPILHAWPM